MAGAEAPAISHMNGAGEPARPRSAGPRLPDPEDRSARGAQEPVDGAGADPAAVLESVLDRVAEVEPDEDA